MDAKIQKAAKEGNIYAMLAVAYGFGFNVVEGVAIVQQRQAAYDRRHDAARCKEDP